MASSAVEAPSRAKVALELACARLLALQHEGGWWQGELQTNVTMDAEDMLLREFLGIRREDETRRTAAWIRSQQRADGTWANFYGGPGGLATPIQAYWAPPLAGRPPPRHDICPPAGLIPPGRRVAPPPRLSPLGLARAERWIVRRQEADGSWGGIQPPWVYSLMALHLCGYPLEHPVMRRGLEGLNRFMVEDRDDSREVGAPAGPSRRLEACQSTVWDTALAIIALRDAGVAAEHPALVRAARWLLGEEVRGRGDWSIARPHLEPGGWAFEFANVNYPDVDDTAEVVLALRRVAGVASDGAIERGRAWVEGMQTS